MSFKRYNPTKEPSSETAIQLKFLIGYLFAVVIAGIVLW